MHTAPTPDLSSAPANTSRRPGIGMILRNFGVPVGVPVGLYYGLHLAGASPLVAYGAGGVFCAIASLVSLARTRRADPITLVVLGVTLAGLAASGLTGNARLMVAKDSLGTAAFGLAVLIGGWRGRPVIGSAARRFVIADHPELDPTWERLAATDRRFVGLLRRLDAIWGTVFCVEAVARVVASFTLPVGDLALVSTGLMIVATGLGWALGTCFAARPAVGMVFAEAHASRDDDRLALAA